MSEENIFSKFKEHSIAEFFKKNRQMLGFSGKIRSMTTIIHEYVTNSLDACQEAGILPDIYIEIKEMDKDAGKYKIIVEDNGPGIPKTHLGKALGMMLAGTKFHRYIQQRGQQGIGASGCTMYAILTSGKGIHVQSRYKGKKIECDLSVDFKTNSPVMENVIETEDGASGVKIEAEFGELKYEKSNYGPYEYIRRTALVNPYLKITFKDPYGEVFIFQRSSEQIPKKPKEIQPHPLGITANDLLEMAKREKKFNRISSFLQNRFSRITSSKVNEVKELVKEVDFNKNPSEVVWEEAEKIAKAFKQVKWISPSPEGIEPIGGELIEKSFINVLNPEMVAVIERKPAIYRGGVPFIVETCIGYGGGISQTNKKGEIMRFANRSPLLFDSGGCAITETVKQIDWKRYGFKEFEEEPVVVVVNISSPHIPYVSAGKQSISNEEEISDEIKNAIMGASREIQKYLSGKRREKEKEGRKKVVERYVQQFAKDLSELAESGKPEDIESMLHRMIEKKYGE
ncbi:MAG: DNA topoisomerase VI subunit B [Candidatus ainarchaeum sp.]|nr:DNA topoisomerase VI subunit B [Candidatus ainarchaeum sp.]